MKLAGNYDRSTLLEGCAQSQYGWGVINKTRQIYKGTTLMVDDVSRLSSSCFPRMYMQFQAAISPLSKLTTSKSANESLFYATCSESYTDSGYLSHLFDSFKEKVNTINAHPIMQTTRIACLVKQTFDFSIASAQWVTGNRTNKSMLHNTVNTALSYAPFMLAYTSFGETLPGQVLGNAILLGCLAYSVRQDFFQSIDRSQRESSPTVALAKRFILPKVQSIFSRVWG